MSMMASTVRRERKFRVELWVKWPCADEISWGALVCLKFMRKRETSTLGSLSRNIVIWVRYALRKRLEHECRTYISQRGLIAETTGPLNIAAYLARSHQSRTNRPCKRSYVKLRDDSEDARKQDQSTDEFVQYSTRTLSMGILTERTYSLHCVRILRCETMLNLDESSFDTHRLEAVFGLSSCPLRWTRHFALDERY